MIRSAYQARERVQVITPEDEAPRTKQQFKDECDINNILAKYQRTGVLEHVRKHGAQYGFAPAVDFQEAMNLIAKATEQYNELPSSVRKDFAGPAEFLEFCEDPANHDALAEYGLAKPRQLPPDPPAKPSPPATDPPAAPAATADDS